jgi:hypothetical protein
MYMSVATGPNAVSRPSGAVSPGVGRSMGIPGGRADGGLSIRRGGLGRRSCKPLYIKTRKAQPHSRTKCPIRSDAALAGIAAIDAANARTS